MTKQITYAELARQIMAASKSNTCRVRVTVRDQKGMIVDQQVAWRMWFLIRDDKSVSKAVQRQVDEGFTFEVTTE